MHDLQLYNFVSLIIISEFVYAIKFGKLFEKKENIESILKFPESKQFNFNSCVKSFFVQKKAQFISTSLLIFLLIMKFSIGIIKNF